MKVLVTGGAGFIGRHLVEYYQDKGEVRVLDDLRSGFEQNLEGLRCQFIKGSILEGELVRDAMRDVDFVFHLAAMVSVPESIEKADECRRINQEGTLLLLEAAAAAGVKRFVFSSSAAIYGDNPVVPKIETMAPEPKSPYAATKFEAEEHCRRFHAEGRLETICLRYFNAFGPYQNPRSQYAAAVPIFIVQALENRPITIYGNGGQTRDFIYVKDVVAANAFFTGAQTPAGETYNVASGRHITVNELASDISRLTNSSSQIQYAAERPGDVKHSVAEVDKLQGAGFNPACDFGEGLKATIDFFRNQARPTGAPTGKALP